MELRVLRARLPAHPDARPRLPARLEAALAPLAEDDGILILRRLGARLGVADWQRPAWENAGGWQALRAQVTAARNRARQPWRETVATDAPAVRFEDPAQMLACAARDWLEGRLAAWWWDCLASRDTTGVIALWSAHPRQQGRAWALLAERGLAAAFTRRLGGDLASLGRTWAATQGLPPHILVRPDTSPLPPRPAPSTPWPVVPAVAPVANRNGGSPARQSRWRTERAASPPRPADAVAEPATPTPSESPGAPSAQTRRPTHPPVASAVRAAPPTPPWPELAAGLTNLPAPWRGWLMHHPGLGGGQPTAPASRPWRPTHPHATAPDTPTSGTGRPTGSTAPAAHSTQSAWRLLARRTAARTGARAADADPRPDMPASSAAGHDPAALGRADYRSIRAPVPLRAWSAPPALLPYPGPVLETRCGGLFHLLNLAQALGLYGDFTTPLTAGLPLHPWDFLALAGEALLGGTFRADPLATWLAAQAGRPPGVAPGTWAPPPHPDWRLPQAWLAPWPTGGARLRVSADRHAWWHPAGFCLADLPGGWRGAGRPTLARCLPPPAPIAGWADWMTRLAPYLTARLARSTGLPRDRVVARLLARPGRVQRAGIRVWVRMSLAELPLELRLAGLDRDLGWLPAAGCELFYLFETGVPE
jgi:hypothetical protein